MFSSSTEIRVHYALTDQMGVVYHGHYAQFFEIARTESIRQLGFTYKEVEQMGIIMPVTDLHIRYLRPIVYDDLIKVTVYVRDWPIHHKIVFHCEIHNSHGEQCSIGEVTLYFMDKTTMKRSQMPKPLEEKLAPFFEKD